MNTTTPRLISPEAASKALGVAEGTLSAWRSNGRYNLPFTKVGRKVFYQEDHINDFIKDRTCSNFTEGS